MSVVPTKAQRELLTWLVAYEDKHNRDGRGVEFSGGDLIDYYRQRKIRQLQAHYESRNEPTPAWINEGDVRGGYANHGWRRAGGTALARLAERGFVERVGITWGVPQYMLTDKGHEVGCETT